MDYKHSTNTESTIIKLPECPRCRSIRFTLRYLNHAKTQLKLIDEKKYKQYGDPNENEKNRHDLKISIKDLRLKPSLLEIFTSELSISKILYGKMPLSADDLLNFKNIWTMYSDLQKVESKIKENKDKGLLQDPLALAHLSYELNKMNGLLYSSYGHGNQRLTELSFESRRVGHLLNFYLLEKNVKIIMQDDCHDMKKEDLEEIVDLNNQLKEILFLKIQQCNSDLDLKVENLIKNLKKLVHVEITQEEKKMIHKAMGLTQGHWFKCPNGHTYCITECGGAMEKSTCPDCKEEIGGTNHSLLSSNTLASDMDGAQFAAWSDTANNMGNWDI